MRYRILGPLEVSDGKRVVRLAQGRQRLLLAVLLVHANEAISTDRLIDALWGEAPPPTAARSLHNLVSSLRKSLPDGELETRGHGYLLRVDDDQLDAARFQTLVERGRAELTAGQPERAAALLGEAIDLWRGPALADLAYEPPVADEAARLEETRLAAVEDRIDADLTLGRHTELAPELDALVARHPLRERLRAQQMLALYRAGRQADALRAYADTRRHLLDELGIEPGPALRQLERAVLQHDPSLGAPDPLPPPPRRPGGAVVQPPASRHRPRPAVLVATGGLLAAVAIAVPLITGGSHSGSDRIGALPGNSLAGIDPNGDRIVASVPIGGSPSSVTIGGGAVWALNADDQTIARVEPRSGHVRTVGVGATPTGLAAGRTELWVASNRGFGTDHLLRVGTDDLAVHGEIELPRANHQGAPEVLQRIAVGPDAVWAINGGDDLARVDRRTNAVTRVRRLRARAVTVDGDSVWALASDAATLVRVDGRTAEVRRRIQIPATRLDAIATRGGVVWAADSYDGLLWRIEPGPRTVTRTITVGVGADGVAVGAGAVWIVNSLRGTLVRVDPRSNRIVRTVAVGNTPRAVAVGDGRVWVTLAGGTASVPAAGTSNTPALPRSICGRVFSAAGAPADYLIASDLPLTSGPEYGMPSLASAAELVLRQHRFRAGRFRIAYQSCDDETTDSDSGPDERKCEADAKAYAANPRLLGIIGPLQSSCALVELPILNAARPGPLAVVSATNSTVTITHRDPRLPRDALARLYPTRVRNYVRVYPPDDAEAAADVVLARRLGLRRVYVLDDQSEIGPAFASYFRRAARARGLGLAGSAHWDPAGRGFAGLADRVRTAHADGVFLAGLSGSNLGGLARALRTRLGSGLTLIGPNPAGPSEFVYHQSDGIAKGMYMSQVGEAHVGARGRRFVRDVEATRPGFVRGEVPYVAAATEVLLEAIARSDGRRASVARALFAINQKDGFLGPLHFDRNGDPVGPPVTIFRVGNGGQSVEDRVIAASPPGR
jgi:DNA-binding SARP family transcriptional activator/ABC-type branched-subunit amino acid transport system substrate-binding protein/streptogramin lyase